MKKKKEFEKWSLKLKKVGKSRSTNCLMLVEKYDDKGFKLKEIKYIKNM